jgi:hypothetical protein
MSTPFSLSQNRLLSMNEICIERNPITYDEFYELPR